MNQSYRETLLDEKAGEKRPQVVVLGAGVCGLYAARTLVDLGVHVTVIERLDTVGGLASGYERNGNYYDIGVHHLHQHDQDILNDVMGILGDELHPVELSAKIKHGNAYRRYPLEFSDLLFGIPPGTLARCVTGLLLQQARNKVRPVEAVNAEEALIQLYGKPLYEYFFEDFTTRYWGIPPERLSATFVKRKMPRLSAVDVIKEWLSKLGVKSKDVGVESAVRKETLYFSEIGASMMPRGLADYITEKGGQVILEAEVVGVETEKDRVVAVTYQKEGEEYTLRCDACVSTIPLPVLVQAFQPHAPIDVLDSSEAIRYKAIAVYGLLVDKEKVFDDVLYVYFRDRIFHRVSEPKNSGVRITPEDHTTILLEMTCTVGDDRWSGGESTVKQIVADLKAEGLVEPDEIVELYVLNCEYGYPVYDLGFEPHLDRLRAYLQRFENLRSVGRQGDFSFPNMHTAMRMGAEASKALLAQATSPRSNGRADGHP